jgi:quinoprotein glucose dehydrogenase
VEERAVPQSDVPGERASPTQPFPVLPKPLAPQRLTPDSAWGLTEADRQWCRDTIAKLRSEGVFTPPSVKGTLVVPGNIGGAHWGGIATDPERGLIVVPTNRLPAIVRLVPRAQYDAQEMANTHGEISPQLGTAYGMWREFLLTPARIPCNPPPWGTLTAIDAATGLVKWEVPLGYIPWIKDTRAAQWGSINLGGPIVTGGGLVFIGATFDNHLRAFDIDTGRELWAGELPVAAKAVPMTYRVREGGKQYLVVAAGGASKTGLPTGDYLVAFALP